MKDSSCSITAMNPSFMYSPEFQSDSEFCYVLLTTADSPGRCCGRMLQGLASPLLHSMRILEIHPNKRKDDARWKVWGAFRDYNKEHSMTESEFGYLSIIFVFSSIHRVVTRE